MHGKNTIVLPHPAWAALYDYEWNRLQPALAGIAPHIEHFGSTAILELKAKPIIDILVGIDVLDRWVKCVEPLGRLGYCYFSDAGVPAHHVFSRDQEAVGRTHLLHVVQFDSPQWTLNLGFRDRLRRDPELRRRYQGEKERAAARAPSDRLAYNAYKSRFIQAVMADLAAGEAQT